MILFQFQKNPVKQTSTKTPKTTKTRKPPVSTSTKKRDDKSKKKGRSKKEALNDETLPLSELLKTPVNKNKSKKGKSSTSTKVDSTSKATSKQGNRQVTQKLDEKSLVNGTETKSTSKNHKRSKSAVQNLEEKSLVNGTEAKSASKSHNRSKSASQSLKEKRTNKSNETDSVDQRGTSAESITNHEEPETFEATMKNKSRIDEPIVPPLKTMAQAFVEADQVNEPNLDAFVPVTPVETMLEKRQRTQSISQVLAGVRKRTNPTTVPNSPPEDLMCPSKKKKFDTIQPNIELFAEIEVDVSQPQVLTSIVSGQIAVENTEIVDVKLNELKSRLRSKSVYYESPSEIMDEQKTVNNNNNQNWIYKCGYIDCGKEFRKFKTLTEHENDVHKKWTYNCTKCPKTFHRERSAKNHMTLEHNIQDPHPIEDRGSNGSLLTESLPLEQ